MSLLNEEAHINVLVQLGCSQGTNTFECGGCNITILVILMLLLENTRRDTLTSHRMAFMKSGIYRSSRYSAL